jgi:hypothetical protein
LKRALPTPQLMRFDGPVDRRGWTDVATSARVLRRLIQGEPLKPDYLFPSHLIIGMSAHLFNLCLERVGGNDRRKASCKCLLGKPETRYYSPKSGRHPNNSPPN